MQPLPIHEPKTWSLMFVDVPVDIMCDCVPMFIAMSGCHMKENLTQLPIIFLLRALKS